jgi:chromosome partitioning protein
MAELVNEAREINDHLRAVVVVNAADAVGKDNQEAAEVLKEISGIEILAVTIGRRKAFPNATSAGKAVTEYTPRDAKAIEELTRLAELLYIEKIAQ